ncbi:RNA polymerase sigma factor SigJ [Saccharothrix texasensis]|uniref:RNA polymerase sigma-70 factor (ECF subfamily) n=1 Tax=Saccharothrix texasensis TaxID=103734 RepID=A0A3N1HJA7_9PSEU|nr:RNA polymerase sigma factor SigJ [Saccharothrix texasensis]ROP42556.1 RNA polymerase sigma-70 factor (ECF subfamily) [Saccharothrix texasensis]
MTDRATEPAATHPAEDPPAEARLAELAAEYTRLRPRLVGVAYSLVGTVAEAQDVVSDCWLRLTAADAQEPVRDVEAWSVVAVARRAVDVLRSARVRREEYVGPWLPEPLVDAVAEDPADRVTLDDTVSFALMVVLETLTPAERTTWVLHEVFGMPFPEVAAVVGRSPAAVRQLAVRARAHVAAGAPRVDVGAAEHRRAVEAFLRAVGHGDLAGLLSVLDPDVLLTSDGGGLQGVARRPVAGADRVARFLVGVRRKMAADERVVPLTVNGGPGFAVLAGATTRFVCSFTLRGGRVRRVDLVVAPDKLPR